QYQGLRILPLNPVESDIFTIRHLEITARERHPCASTLSVVHWPKGATPTVGFPALLLLGGEKGSSRGERAFALQGLQGDPCFCLHARVIISTERLERVDPRLYARKVGP